MIVKTLNVLIVNNMIVNINIQNFNRIKSRSHDVGPQKRTHCSKALEIYGITGTSQDFL